MNRLRSALSGALPCPALLRQALAQRPGVSPNCALKAVQKCAALLKPSRSAASATGKPSSSTKCRPCSRRCWRSQTKGDAPNSRPKLSLRARALMPASAAMSASVQARARSACSAAARRSRRSRREGARVPVSAAMPCTKMACAAASSRSSCSGWRGSLSRMSPASCRLRASAATCTWRSGSWRANRLSNQPSSCRARKSGRSMLTPTTRMAQALACALQGSGSRTASTCMPSARGSLTQSPQCSRRPPRASTVT